MIKIILLICTHYIFHEENFIPLKLLIDSYNVINVLAPTMCQIVKSL